MILNCYFVSDIHIKDNQDPKHALFLKFLREKILAQSGTHLFLVGDIFDLWIGDHMHFIEHYQDAIQELTYLQDEGVEIHYFEGNHDLYLDKFWHRRLGFHVYPDAEMFSFPGIKLRV